MWYVDSSEKSQPCLVHDQFSFLSLTFLLESHVGNIRMGPFISQGLGSLYILFIANAMEDNSMCGCMRGISTTCVQRYVHDGSEMRRATQTPLRRPAGRNRNSTF
jgi:hypothetical protein